MRWYNLWQYRWRLVILGCMAAAVVSCFYRMPGMAMLSQPVAGTSLQPVVPPAQAQISSRQQPELRDPFRVPSEFQNRQTVARSGEKSPAGLPPEMPAPAAPEIPLELVGIVSGKQLQVAIINQAGVSRSYQIKEAVGPYQLLAIEEGAVILAGPQGKKVLTLKR